MAVHHYSAVSQFAGDAAGIARQCEAIGRVAVSQAIRSPLHGSRFCCALLRLVIKTKVRSRPHLTLLPAVGREPSGEILGNRHDATACRLTSAGADHDEPFGKANVTPLQSLK